MYSLVPAYDEPTDDQLEEIWSECLFAFDANTLLDVSYRYSPKTQARFLEILDHIRDTRPY